jgi:hypothetical protein
VDSHRSAGGQLLQPSDVYSSTKAVVWLCERALHCQAIAGIVSVQAASTASARVARFDLMGAGYPSAGTPSSLQPRA